MPAMTTAFKEDDQLDLPLFEKNITAQKEAGVSAIIIGGSLGEASTITLGEKEILVKTALELLDHTLPVIVNIAECTTHDAVNLAKLSLKWGADGLMLLPPMRYKSTENETIAYFEAVAAATDLPIMLYNNPVDYKVEITLNIFEKVSGISSIVGVKDSTRDLTNIHRVRNAFGDRYRILCGVDPLAYEALCSGVDGWVAGLVDALPRETVAIYKLVKAGKLAEALSIFQWFLPLLEFDTDTLFVQYIKLTEAYTGIGNEYVRAPRLPLSGEVRTKTIEIIEKALASRPQLPDYLSL